MLIGVELGTRHQFCFRKCRHLCVFERAKHHEQHWFEHLQLTTDELANEI